MKNNILFIILASALFSCSKTIEKNAVVIKDCTGSYIRQDSVDYFICNDDMVAAIENGTEVSVTFKTVENCDQPDDAICLMLHLSEGNIEITKLN